jgi:uncharacterized protein VirK/YbjX
MAVGFLLSPRATTDWLDYIAQTPFLEEALKQQPKLITKIFRPYLATGYNCDGRVQILKTHYQAAQALGLSTLMGKSLLTPQLIYQGSTKSESTFELQLSASIQGHREGEFCLSLIYQGNTKSDSTFELHLSASFQGHREGEFCVSLMYQDHSLFELNCTLAKIDEKPCLIVGRLQGTGQNQAQNLVRQATSDLHACRPANLMLHAARNLAAIWQCDSLLLISNRKRIALNLWRRFHITANYDKTWTEAGATLRDDGWYELEPLSEKDIDLSDIASKKRAEAKRRQALLNGIYLGLKTFFKTPHHDTSLTT